ncbi:hypothetical protein LJC74_07525 [Eubacteriales bacterium OttesenSCG-928-A19]|nr:hypothetical protein [Eubacteriales bacterium OttesenSCG-928-A19]
MHHDHEHNHEHHHDHDHDHHHHHEHGCDCGCDHDHIEIARVEGMTVLQQNMLLGLFERRFLPVAAFELQKAGETAHATALAPVYLGTPQDTMEQVKALGGELEDLEDRGLIALDYDARIADYAYQEYTDSALYAYFVQTVAEGRGRPGALFDTAGLLLGSMALTQAGEEAVRAMIP